MLLSVLCSIVSIAQDKLEINDFTIKPGETKTLSVELINEIEYAAFQFNLTLPKGLDIVTTINEDDEEVLDITLDENRKKSTHMLVYELLPTGEIRIAAYSSKNADFKNKSGVLVNMTVKASEDMEAGEHVIKLTNIKFVDSEENGYPFSDVVKNILVVKNYNISATSADKAKGSVDIKNGGEAVAHGTSVTVTASPVAGYSFVNWTVGETVKSTENPYTFTATENVSLVGNFKANVYDVTFDVDGVKTTSSQEFGTTITKPEDPKKEGYTFTGWSPAFVDGATVPVDGITYVAQWQINTYKLTYQVDGKDYKTVDVTYGASITPEADPTKEGHTFSGWSEIPATMPANDVVVTGSFSVNTYNLIYMVDGEVYNTVQVKYGETITPEPAPVKEGYVFSGWNEIPRTMPANDVTVTGTLAKAYTITYILDGVEYEVAVVGEGFAIIPEEAPYKEGYTFSGWTELPATMPGSNITVTGVYTINTYKLKYVVDGEDYKMVDVTYGESIIPEELPTKEGHTFSGWSEIPATMPAYDVVVTGNFSVNTYKLIYMVDGEVYKTVDVKYGETITAEADPVKEGYLFSGWSEIPETMPANDVTVTGSFVVDGVDSVVTNKKVDVYTLAGVKVAIGVENGQLKTILKKGVYIINGKKVIVK